MTDAMKEQALQMAREGKTVAAISRELGVDYWTVWSHVPYSWMGAKKIITGRLKRLIRENNQATRKQLVKEADAFINRIYDDAKRLGRRIDRARKALDD